MEHESTRPDPKVQIGALLELARVMAERGLPAMDVRVVTSGRISVNAHGNVDGRPRTWDQAKTMADAWMAALGMDADREQVFEHPKDSGRWLRSLTAHGSFAGSEASLFVCVAVDAPVEAVSS